MPSGLIALFDDVAMIAKVAAASLDDVGVAAGKAGTKAAGVVIDDAAVTPSYVTDFTPSRELPVIAAIARGSVKNKLLFILPVALLLSELLPWAITPVLMLGGLYLSFEGAEKVIEWLGGAHHGQTLEDPIADVAEFERQRIAGAIRTDLILSAEIMAIALSEIADAPLVQRGAVLAVVAVAITALVYGAVALIVKMDDIGLHLAERSRAPVRAFGRGLVAAMPVTLWVLSKVGTVAMLWVGGGILIHGLEVLGWDSPAHLVHRAQEAIEHATGPAGGALAWLTYALASAAIAMAVGAVLAGLVHQVQALRARPDATAE